MIFLFLKDINECLELDSACGPGDGHYCINKKGGYTCSCAPYYRLDNTGTTCIGIPAHVKDSKQTIYSNYLAVGSM